MDGAGIIRHLTDLLGEGAVRHGEAVSVLDPGLDPRNLDAGIVVLPGSTTDVQKVLSFCQANRIAVVPQGGRTGLAGGAVSAPEQVVLSLQRLSRITGIDPVSALAEVEAGVTLAALDRALEPHGLCAGIDLGARDSATIGGMISTNAGGIEAFRHGVMRQRVSGLEAVLADGTVVSDLSRVGKCNEGYDIKQLFIGAEGTLGVVTRAVLSLVSRPRARATALVAAPTMAGALQAFRAAAPSLLAFELMNGPYFAIATADQGTQPFTDCSTGYFFVVEMEGGNDDAAHQAVETFLAMALEQDWISDAVICKSGEEQRKTWILREDSWVVDRHFPGGLWFDVTVPLAALDDYVMGLEEKLAAAAPQLRLFVIGHLGDGNLHLTIAGPEPADDHRPVVSGIVHEGLKAMGGSFSAEHGIGLEKQSALVRYGDPGKRRAMLAVKAALDPSCIMNPGKVL